MTSVVPCWATVTTKVAGLSTGVFIAVNLGVDVGYGHVPVERASSYSLGNEYLEDKPPAAASNSCANQF